MEGSVQVVENILLSESNSGGDSKGKRKDNGYASCIKRSKRE